MRIRNAARSLCGFALLGMFVMGMAPNEAWASCNQVDLTLTPAVYSFNSGTTVKLLASLNRRNNAPCTYFMTFSYGAGGSFSGRRLASGAVTIPMNLYGNASLTQVLKDEPDATLATDVLAGNYPSGAGPDTRSHDYWANLALPNLYLPTGVYEETFTVSLYEGTVGGSHSLESSQTLKFTYNVLPRVDLSLVDTGGAFNLSDTAQALNFGTLSTGQARSFDIVLQHNSGYSLFFSSANGGALKHTSLSNTVPYTMSVSGQAVSLAGSASTPKLVASGAGAGSAAGTRLPVVTTIGTLTGAVGGRYTDLITVTVQSNQ